MDWSALADGPSALIVVGGTVMATILRCGLNNSRRALAVAGGLGRKRFDAQSVRAELAAQVREIGEDGLLRARPHRFGDAEFDDAADALIARRSVAALLDAHEAHRLRRAAISAGAAETFVQAAELAPVFGLAGTLISLSQLPAQGFGASGIGAAIAMAVLTTLYGLLLANLVLAPLAQMIERAAAAEEDERGAAIDWLSQQVSAALPRRGDAKPSSAAA